MITLIKYYHPRTHPVSLPPSPRAPGTKSRDTTNLNACVCERVRQCCCRLGECVSACVHQSLAASCVRVYACVYVRACALACARVGVCGGLWFFYTTGAMFLTVTRLHVAPDRLFVALHRTAVQKTRLHSLLLATVAGRRTLRPISPFYKNQIILSLTNRNG